MTRVSPAFIRDGPTMAVIRPTAVSSKAQKPTAGAAVAGRSESPNVGASAVVARTTFAEAAARSRQPTLTSTPASTRFTGRPEHHIRRSSQLTRAKVATGHHRAVPHGRYRAVTGGFPWRV